MTLTAASMKKMAEELQGALGTSPAPAVDKGSPYGLGLLGKSMAGLGAGIGAGYLGTKAVDAALRAKRGYGLTPGGRASAIPFVAGALGLAAPMLHHGLVEKMRGEHFKHQEARRGRKHS